MKKKFFLPLFMFISYYSVLNGKGINKVREIQLDESAFVLHSLPTCFIPLNDTTVCFNHWAGKLYVANFKTGAAMKVIDFHDLISTKHLAGRFTAIDTSDNDYDYVLDEWSKLGKNDIVIESITSYNDSLLFGIVDISFPSYKWEDTNKVYSEEKVPFYVLIKKENFAVIDCNPFKLKWLPEKRSYESAMFGFAISEDNIYIARTAFPEYAETVFSTFNKYTFDPINAPSINHIPYKLDLPYAQYIPIVSWNKSTLLSCNGIIYNATSGNKLIDIRDYVENISSVNFFTPLDREASKYFMYLFSTYDTTTRSFPRKIAIVDTKTKKIDDIKIAPLTKFCSYKDNIISIEKRDTGYYFITYKK